jgi:hypothetical protein
MVISGGAQFTLHPPKTTLKGNVEVRLSTDGKILLAGDLLFMDGLQRAPARIYGNLSQIAKGNATLLLMVQDMPAGQHPVIPPIPVPLPIGPAMIPIPTSLQIIGGISMRYYDSSGKEVDFYTGEGTATTGKIQLYSPAPEGKVGLGVLLKNRELRVKYTASSDATLDVASITDGTGAAGRDRRVDPRCSCAGYHFGQRLCLQDSDVCGTAHRGLHRAFPCGCVEGQQE